MSDGRSLAKALKYLVDVDEDSPAEAQALLSHVHELIKQVRMLSFLLLRIARKPQPLL